MTFEEDVLKWARFSALAYLEEEPFREEIKNNPEMLGKWRSPRLFETVIRGDSEVYVLFSPDFRVCFTSSIFIIDFSFSLFLFEYFFKFQLFINNNFNININRRRW